MTHSIESTSIDNQIPLLLQTEKDEELELKKGMTHSIEITSIDNQTPLLLQTEKDEIKERIDKIFEDLNHSSITSFTIFKVNVGLRESNPAAYTPNMVSIGPYHKDNLLLRSMEKYKALYLQRFLKRNEDHDVKSYIDELDKLKEKALKSYDDIEDLVNDSREFCQMLLLDGCFVIEFIREHCGYCPEGEKEIIDRNIGCMYNQIVRDLMLLENQLPFFVLDKLHHMTKQDNEFPLAMQAVFPFRTFFVDLEKMIKHLLHAPLNINAGNIKHLLHAVHIVSCYGNPRKTSNDERACLKVMPNATELSEAGVSFEKVLSNSNNMTRLFDIKFEDGFRTRLFNIKFENGLTETLRRVFLQRYSAVVSIPCFRIVDDTEILLRNLIAYEQQSSDVEPKYFSDFATFMDYLIDSDKDVNLLRQNGIIENWMGEDKEVASLFNKIANGVTLYPTFYYKQECIKATQHSEKTWNRMMASFMRNYFSNPCVGASTVAAFILLILTTIQTILAITNAVK